MVISAALFLLAPLAAGARPAPTPAFFESHREKFLSRLPAGSVAVLRAPAEPPADARADTRRQDSDFWYLTGFEEPNAVAVFLPGPAKEGHYILFVQPRDFGTEQWTGWRAGVEGAKSDYGATEAHPVAEFWDRLPGLWAAAPSLYYGAGADREFQRRLLDAWNAGNANAASARPAAEVSPILAGLRLIKDRTEQDLLREASRISAEAHRAAMAQTAPGRHEYDLKAAMVGVCLSRGAARTAYPSIVGSGRNSVILHYERDDKELEEGEILVNDTGCEYSMYAADVTRSYPVSGRFSAEQRKIYEIVLAAQKAGLARVRPGTPIKDVFNATVDVVVDGLLRLGILSGSREEVLRTGAYRKFYPHGSSHWIGLDVHDAGNYEYPAGLERGERYGKSEVRLQPGMALTVEPGIYVADRSTPDSKWWNIGVRIEDTVLVTPQGMECLSCDAPKEIADLEKALGKGRSAR